MMILERMDWRKLDAIVGGRRGIERDPLAFVVVLEGGRGVRGVRTLVVLSGEGGGVGGGHGQIGAGQVSSARAAGRGKITSLTLTKRQGTRREASISVQDICSLAAGSRILFIYSKSKMENIWRTERRDGAKAHPREAV